MKLTYSGPSSFCSIAVARLLFLNELNRVRLLLLLLCPIHPQLQAVLQRPLLRLPVCYLLQNRLGQLVIADERQIPQRPTPTSTPSGISPSGCSCFTPSRLSSCCCGSRRQLPDSCCRSPTRHRTAAPHRGPPQEREDSRCRLGGQPVAAKVELGERRVALDGSQQWCHTHIAELGVPA